VQKHGVLITFGRIDYINCTSPNNKYLTPVLVGQFILAKSGHDHGFFRKSKIYFYNKNPAFLGPGSGIEN